MTFQPGDQIKTWRFHRTHHAIFEAYQNMAHVDPHHRYGIVIHSGMSTDGRVTRTVVDLTAMEYRLHKRPASAGACLDRARSRVNRGFRSEDGDYDLVYRNCEHFANWCRTG